MRRKEKIQQEVDKTLDLLEHAPRVKPRSFFYSRLQTRLNKKHAPSPKRQLVSVLKPAFFVVMLLVNIYTIYAMFHVNFDMQTSRESYIEQFGEDFYLTRTENYELMGENK